MGAADKLSGWVLGLDFNKRTNVSVEPPSRGERLAASYIYHQIITYVNEIRAASYSATPSQTGGPAYDYFSSVLDNFAEFEKGQEAEACAYAIQAVRDFIDNDAAGLGDDPALQKHYAYVFDYFQGVAHVVDQMVGENHDDIVPEPPCGGDAPEQAL